MQLGQSRTLPVEKPEQIDLAQAARYFGARGEADTATMALLQRCAVPLLAAATPRAVWLRAEVKALAEAGILRGSDVMRHLEGCGQAILLAVTLGPGVDAQIRRAGVGDIAAGVASDAQRPGGADRRRGGSQAAPAGRSRGELPHRAVLAGLWRLGHRGAAAGGRRAGHGAPGRAVRHRYQPDDPPQKRDRHSGGRRPSGQGTSGRVRALCAAHPLRIQKEGKDLCK